MKHLPTGTRFARALVLAGIAVFLHLSKDSGRAAGIASKESLDDDKFLIAFKQGQIVSNRVIQSSAVIKALRWAQEPTDLNEPIPNALRIEECIIQGDLDSRELRQTKRHEFPPNVRYWINDRFETMAIVPVSIMISNSVIEGNVVLGSLKILTDERIESVVFAGDANFTGTIFRKEVSFTASVFAGEALFDRAVFGDNVYFSDAVFMDKADFVDAKFEQNGDFAGAKFPIRASFFRAVFEGWAWFYKASFEGNRHFFTRTTFNGPAFFVGTHFPRETDFDGAIFYDFADFAEATGANLRFNQTTFRGKAAFSRGTFEWVDFRNTVFEEELAFDHAMVEGTVLFRDTVFPKDVFFNDINTNTVGALKFSRVHFQGRAYFDNTRFNTLWFSTSLVKDENPGGVSYREPWAQPEKFIREGVSPVVFEKRAVLRGLRCVHGDFLEAEFRDSADFAEAQFEKTLNLGEAIFEAEANFHQTKFPRRPKLTQAEQASTAGWSDVDYQPGLGFVVEGLRFQKSLSIEWEQIGNVIGTASVETWRQLEEVFKRSGNLEGQNEAMFHRRVREGARATGWERIGNGLERWFWGYGVRPWRLLGWILVVYFAFTGIYWTQTRALASGAKRASGQMKRFTFALAFSLRTSWKLDYGVQNARTPAFKIVTLIHSIGFKVLLLCLLHVMANLSPLLHELFGSLFHI